MLQANSKMSLEPSSSDSAGKPRRRSNVGGPNSFRDGLNIKTPHFSIDEITLPSIPSPTVLPSQGYTPDISEFNTPLSTRPPSPVGHSGLVELLEEHASIATSYAAVGQLRSWRGAFVLLVTCGSQLMDNIFMTAVNIALPAIQKEFNVPVGDLQWLISAYTLTFGGFLLLSGVLSDR